VKLGKKKNCQELVATIVELVLANDEISLSESPEMKYGDRTYALTK